VRHLAGLGMDMLVVYSFVKGDALLQKTRISRVSVD
jgi:hypothetical protein